LDTWYAVATKPRCEAQAEEHLRRQGYDCLFPRIRRVRRTAAGLKARVESLFPNYLFLRADSERQSLAPVRSTRGALGLVRFGGEPAPVPDIVIACICERIDEADGLVRLRAPELVPGQVVRVTEGPLLGWDAMFVAGEGLDRVRLLLQMLGGSREVTLPRQQLGLAI
jgi:transcriptional antiterminator RfaH